jgi:hypothetical protein
LKWISSSEENSLSSQAQTPQGQPVERAIDSFANGDANENNVGNISKENVEFPSHDGSLVEHSWSNGDTPVVLHISNTEDDNGGGAQALGCENLKCPDLGTSSGSLCPDHSQGIERLKFDDHRTESRGVSSDMAEQNVDDLSNDFANTFMLDEEIEIEKKTIKKDDLFFPRRYCILLFLLDLLQLEGTEGLLCLLDDLYTIFIFFRDKLSFVHIKIICSVTLLLQNFIVRTFLDSLGFMFFCLLILWITSI